MEGELPSPNFGHDRAYANGGDGDYMGFSSTPIRGKNFKPKWGKKNRQDNWNRFGQHNQSQDYHMNNSFNDSQSDSSFSHHQNDNSFKNNQNYSHNRSWNSSNGSSRNNSYAHHPQSYQSNSFNQDSSYEGSPHNGGRRGRGDNYTPAYNPGHVEGGDSYTPTPKSKGYFHRNMLTDPWAELEQEMGLRSGFSEERTSFSSPGWTPRNCDRTFSDSMLPQVGDSLRERIESKVEDDIGNDEGKSFLIPDDEDPKTNVVVESEEAVKESQ